MRTTVRIDDDLFRELKRRSSAAGLTLSEVVNRALRQSLSRDNLPKRVFRQKTRDLGRASFDVTRAQAIADGLDDEALLRKLGGSS